MAREVRQSADTRSINDRGFCTCFDSIDPFDYWLSAVPVGRRRLSTIDETHPNLTRAAPQQQQQHPSKIDSRQTKSKKKK
jgi:hypothetical protein